VIVIGEIRNLATLQAAFRAASSGHLVYATLHTSSAAKGRCSGYRTCIRWNSRHQALSDTAAFLAAVISQTLLPSRDGKRPPSGARDHDREARSCAPMIRDAKVVADPGRNRPPGRRLSHLLNHSLAGPGPQAA